VIGVADDLGDQNVADPDELSQLCADRLDPKSAG
jgi:hypothetical protein